MNTLGPGPLRSRFVRIGPFYLSVVLLLALAGCAGSGEPVAESASSPSPVQTPGQTSMTTGWLQTIPETVRIDTNIHAGRDGTLSKQSRRVHQASLLGFCSNALGLDVPSLDAGTVDRVGVDAPDYPGDARTLYLYADAAHARHRFRLVQHWLSGCDGNEGCCTTDLRPSSVGDQSLLEVTTDVGTGAGPTGRWLRLIRVGNALLLTDSNDDSLQAPTLNRDIRRQLRDLAPVLADLRVLVSS